jgi:hypothetical protein
LLWISGRERHTVGGLSIETYLEGVLTGPGQGNVEHQYRPGFYIHDSRGRLAKLDGALTAEKLRAGVVHKADANGVYADFGPPPPHAKHQMGARVDGWEVREPDVLKHAEHAELALLVDQGIVGDDGKVEVQGSADSDGCDDVVLFDLVHHIHAFSDLPEDGVHLIEMRLR